MKYQAETRFRYERRDVCPGLTYLVLTAPWAHLPTGTEVIPLSVGFNNRTNRRERTVIVVATGEKVTAEDAESVCTRRS